MTPLQRLISLLRPEATDIAVVVLFSVVVGILSLAMPITVEALVNTVAFGRYLQPLFILAMMLFTFLGFAAILKGLQTYISEVIQRRIFVRVVAYLAERIPRVNRDAFAKGHGPELLNRFFEVITVQKSGALLVLDGITIVITAFIGMIVLAFYHPFLLGFNLVLVAAVLFAVFALGRGAVSSAIEESYKKYAVAAWLQQLALYPTTFKLGGGLPQAMEKADELTVAYLEARQSHFHVLFRQIIFTLGLQAIAAACLLGIGGFLVINGQLTLGQLVASELIVAVVVGSFAKLGKHMESYYDLLAACDKLGHLFDLPTERSEGITPPRHRLGARVQLHGVELELGKAQCSPALTMTIEAGERVAITGPAGSGKSSILEMLYASQEPSHGYVEFDSLDLRSVAPQRLREQVALVHSIEILEGTIAENIHLHRDSVNHQQVRSALEAVGLWNEIMALEGGLEARVPLGGGTISNSQAIRLMLARAIAGRPRLILIDSILDQLSEIHLRFVFDAIATPDRSCTVILVTSRESLFELCDRTIPLQPAKDPNSLANNNLLSAPQSLPRLNLVSL
ncbi:peptidase domain-containing ABC transporter [Anatilimnocola aggregata]|uniref:peptidase domain-containing ABC transporter n=1 Tax=Anatilimnocola aggregata TaxID=2528021 RepID=UPI001EE3EE09|nr:ATP-binding cassette domain-containing protein [Anatilimnocola aggregata]